MEPIQPTDVQARKHSPSAAVDPTGWFAMVVRIELKPGCQSRAIRLLTDLLSLHEAEPGTLIWTVHFDHDDNNVLWLYELWRDQAALEYHRKNRGPERSDRLRECYATEPTLNYLTPFASKGIDFASLVGSGT